MGFMDSYKTYDVDAEGLGNPGQWRRTFYKKMTKDEAWEILQEEDPFTVLGVKRNSTRDEIKKAFYKLALKWHPDRNPDNSEKATAMMKKINAAYELIK